MDKPKTIEEAEAVIDYWLGVQKINPYGSYLHRTAYEHIRELVKVWFGKDIGEYED